MHIGGWGATPIGAESIETRGGTGFMVIEEAEYDLRLLERLRRLIGVEAVDLTGVQRRRNCGGIGRTGMAQPLTTTFVGNLVGRPAVA